MDCSNCIFRKDDIANLNGVADSDGGTVAVHTYQVGCKAGRLEQLKELGKATMELGCPYYDLHQFCNMYRDMEWVDQHFGNSLDEDATGRDFMLEKALDESEPLFGIVIAGEGNETVEEIAATVESIATLDWPMKKLRVIISTTLHGEMPAIAHIVNSTQKEYHLDVRAVFHTITDAVVKDYDSFNKLAQSTYFVKVRPGIQVPKDICSLVNESLNTKLEKIIMFADEGINIVRARVMQSVYPKFNNYTTALREIRAISKTQGVFRALYEKE